MVLPRLPVRVRHDARHVHAKVEARLRAEAERARRAQKRVRADLRREIAEVRIAALHERVAQVEFAVPPPARAPEAKSAARVDTVARIRRPRRIADRQPCERRQRLERRAGRVGTARRAVEERLRRVVRQATIARGVEARHEVVRIVARRAREGQDVARARIERDARAGEARELRLRDALEADVEREAQVEAALRLLDGARPDRVAVRVHRQLPLAGDAAQVAVVVRLESGAPAQLRQVEMELLAVRRRARAAVAADVAEELRGERPARIRPHLLFLDGEAGEVRLMLGEDGEFALVEAAPDDERHRPQLVDVPRDRVGRRNRLAAERLAERTGRIADRGARLLVAATLELRGVADKARREPAFRKRLAPAVENPSAQAGHAHAPRGLPGGRAAIVRRVLDLELAQLHAQAQQPDGEDRRERPAAGDAQDGLIPLHRTPPSFPPRRRRRPRRPPSRSRRARTREAARRSRRRTRPSRPRARRGRRDT